MDGAREQGCSPPTTSGAPARRAARRRRPGPHGGIRQAVPAVSVPRGSGSVADGLHRVARLAAPAFGALGGDGPAPLLDARSISIRFGGIAGAQGRVGVGGGGRGRGPGGPQRRGQDHVVQLPVRAAAPRAAGRCRSTGTSSTTCPPTCGPGSGSGGPSSASRCSPS